jgi:hypothetical protein
VGRLGITYSRVAECRLGSGKCAWPAVRASAIKGTLGVCSAECFLERARDLVGTTWRPTGTGRRTPRWPRGVASSSSTLLCAGIRLAHPPPLRRPWWYLSRSASSELPVSFDVAGSLRSVGSMRSVGPHEVHGSEPSRTARSGAYRGRRRSERRAEGVERAVVMQTAPRYLRCSNHRRATKLCSEVRDDVLEEVDGPMLQQGLKAFHGSALFTARRELLRPNRQLLEQRSPCFVASPGSGPLQSKCLCGC